MKKKKIKTLIQKELDKRDKNREKEDIDLANHLLHYWRSASDTLQYHKQRHQPSK